MITVRVYVPGFQVPVSRHTAEVAVWPITVGCMSFRTTVGAEIPKLVPVMDN